MRGTFAAGGDTAAVLDGERDEVFAACALRGRDYRPHLRVGSVCRADANAAEDLGDLLDEFRLALIRHEDTGAERAALAGMGHADAGGGRHPPPLGRA